MKDGGQIILPFPQFHYCGVTMKWQIRMSFAILGLSQEHLAIIRILGRKFLCKKSKEKGLIKVQGRKHEVPLTCAKHVG